MSVCGLKGFWCILMEDAAAWRGVPLEICCIEHRCLFEFLCLFFFSYFRRTLSCPRPEKTLRCWAQIIRPLRSPPSSPLSLSPSLSAVASHALLLSPSISLSGPSLLCLALSLGKTSEGSAITFGADQKRGSLQWNKWLHNSCGEMALIADWFEAEAADICNAEPHLPHSPHHSPLWLSIVQPVYFVVMSGKWQVKEAKGARHQIGPLSKKDRV